MPRITLAHWHAGRAPGEDIDVSDEELKQLQRDGRVATVHGEESTADSQEQPDPQPEPGPEPPAEAEPEPASEEAAPPSRKRR